MNTLVKILRSSAGTFQQDARAWGLTQKQALVIASVPVLIILITIAAIPMFHFFVFLTEENSLWEWLQFVFLNITWILFTWLGVRLLRRGELPGLLSLLAGLAVFFIAGEEIAWGQQIFGWQTPELFSEMNAQNETTLHNFSSAHELFILAVMLVGMYGTLVPFATPFLRKRLYRQGNRQRLLLASLLIPPLCLVPSFIMPFAYRLVRLLLPIEEWFEHLIYPITKMSEATELCLYFGLMIWAWLNFRRLGQKQEAVLPSGKSWKLSESDQK